MLSYKKLIVIVSLLSVVVFITTTAMQQQQQQEGFKNLKVLPKNIGHEELGKVMDEWRDALGVKCGFCHVRNTETNKMDWASDGKKEKEMARNMMKMTAKINKKFFKMDKGDEHGGDMMAAIACITCHHGAAHPANGSMKPKEGDHNGPPPAGGTTPPKQ